MFRLLSLWFILSLSATSAFLMPSLQTRSSKLYGASEYNDYSQTLKDMGIDADSVFGDFTEEERAALFVNLPKNTGSSQEADLSETTWNNMCDQAIKETNTQRSFNPFGIDLFEDDKDIINFIQASAKSESKEQSIGGDMFLFQSDSDHNSDLKEFDDLADLVLKQSDGLVKPLYDEIEQDKAEMSEFESDLVKVTDAYLDEPDEE
jgi:hypothetical protein